MVKIKGVGRLLAWLLNPRRQQRFVQVCHYTATQNTFIILCAFLCNLKTVFDERHEGALCQLFHGTLIKRVSLQLRGTKLLGKLMKGPAARFTSTLAHTPGFSFSR
jgi:hypothetical protein